nr:OmpW family outer membrane protein [Larsenimonas suaedae]
MNACAGLISPDRHLVFAVILLTGCFSLSAQAATDPTSTGAWLLRAEIVTSRSLDVDTDAGQLGGEYYAPPIHFPTLSLTRLLSPSWAIQLSGGVSTTAVHLEDTLFGDIDAGEVTTAAVMASLQYYLPTSSPLRPYLGAGVAYAWPLDVSPSEGIGAFKVNTLLIPVAQLGLDYHLGVAWSVGLSATYLFVPAQRYSGDGFDVEVDLDQLALGAGVGYRF